MSEELCKFGYIDVDAALVDRLLCSGSLPRAVDVMVVLFWRLLLAPVHAQFFADNLYPVHANNG